MKKFDEEMCYVLLKTRFGPVALVWVERYGIDLVRRVFLSRPGRPAQHNLGIAFPGAMKRSCKTMDVLGREIISFLDGQEVIFTPDIICLDLCSTFQQQVLLAEHQIPRGSVSTYQRLATQIGKPLSARAVGAALARNPFPILIPCHRAICSDMTLGGYQGGIEMKRDLLELEGVGFDFSGKVLSTNMYYHTVT